MILIPICLAEGQKGIWGGSEGGDGQDCRLLGVTFPRKIVRLGVPMQRQKDTQSPRSLLPHTLGTA